MPRKRVWDKNSIIRAIRQLAAEGKSLAPKHIRIEDQRLFGAAAYHFGSWGKAVEAAGINYQAVLEQSKEQTIAARKPRGYWDRAKVLAAIQARLEDGKPLSSLAVQLDDGPLVAAAVRYLGSWEQAVEEATGLSYKDIRLYDEWDKEKILKEIRERYRLGKTLRGSAVLRHANALYNAARIHFGSWRAAIEEAGLPYLDVATSWHWDKKRLHQALREWAESGKPGLPRDLQSPVRRLYCSWEKALEAAGLDPNLAKQRSLRRTWTKAEVIQAIRERAEQGKSLLQSDVRKEDIRLLEAARRAFGTWVQARAAALGTAPKRLRR